MSKRPEFAEIDVRLARVLKRAGLDVKVVFDIGASNGYWSVHLSEVFPEAAFHLFEPLAEKQQSYVGLLQGNLAAHPNFTLHPIALGEAESAIELWTDPEGFSSTAIGMNGNPAFVARRVPMHRLDEYVACKGIPFPDFIKIDVQGFEDRILRHGEECMQRARALLLETWLHRGYGDGTPLLGEIMDLVGNHGFDLVEFGDRYYGKAHKLVHVDALFLKRDWAAVVGDAFPDGDWAYEQASVEQSELGRELESALQRERALATRVAGLEVRDAERTAALEASRVWRLATRYRVLRNRVLPPGSPVRLILERVMRRPNRNR